MNNLISAKALAEELGVSKVTLFKKIDRLNLRSELQKQGKALMIPYEVAEKLREAYKGAEREPEKAEEPNSTKASEDITSALVEMLKEELKSKNQQIENLQKQIDGLLEDNRRYMALNTQLLLTGSSTPAEPVEAEIIHDEEERTPSELRENELNSKETQEKKSFFRRLFGL